MPHPSRSEPHRGLEIFRFRVHGFRVLGFWGYTGGLEIFRFTAYCSDFCFQVDFAIVAQLLHAIVMVSVSPHKNYHRHDLLLMGSITYLIDNCSVHPESLHWVILGIQVSGSLPSVPNSLSMTPRDSLKIQTAARSAPSSMRTAARPVCAHGA